MKSALAVLAALVLSLVAVVPGPTAQARSAADTYALVAQKATNLQRVLHDRPKLGANTCLRKAAHRQAARMAERQELFHQDLTALQSRCGMGWVGENVAYGYATGKAVVRAWMRSPGHRANILKRDYRLMGIAAVRRDGTWWVSQVFGTRA